MEENIRKQFKVTEEILAKTEQRLFNFIIDTMMLVILVGIALVVVINVTTANGNKGFINQLMANSLWQFALSSVITLLYYNLFEIFTSRTVGKFCTNTIIVDENGDKVNYEAIMIRSLIRIVPFYWASFFVFPKRGVHDMVSKTFVVNKKMLEEKKQQFYSIQ